MRSIIQDSEDRWCYLCHRTGPLEVHHVLHGSRRKMADRYGLTVYLCPECHRNLHDHGMWDIELEQVGQILFESRYGHEKFMKIFGKNYL